MHRSMNPSQRALVAAGFLEYEREQAKTRQSASGGDRKSGVESFPPPIDDAGKARDKAGEASACARYMLRELGD